MLKKLFAVRNTRVPLPVTGDRMAMTTASAIRTSRDSTLTWVRSRNLIIGLKIFEKGAGPAPGPRLAYLTNSSIGSVPASSTSLVSTMVGT